VKEAAGRAAAKVAPTPPQPAAAVIAVAPLPAPAPKHAHAAYAPVFASLADPPRSSAPLPTLPPPLPPPLAPRLPGFLPLHRLAPNYYDYETYDDEGLPPPLPPPRAPVHRRAPSPVGLSGLEIPDSYRCPITHELLEDPVVTADGQTYERHAITNWLASHDTSPLTGETLQHTRLTPNVMARSLILEWAERHGIDTKRRY